MSIPVKRRLWRKNRPLFEVRKPTQSRTSTTTTCPLKPWRGAGRDGGLRRQLSRTTSASAQSNDFGELSRVALRSRDDYRISGFRLNETYGSLCNQSITT